MSANPRLLGAAAVALALGLAAALVVLSPAGATTPRTTTASVASRASPSPAPIPTRASEDPDTAGMDRGCSRSLVRLVVSSFIDAVNRRDQQALAGLFGPDFRWVSINSGDRLTPWGTFDRSELPTYFAARWAQHERWMLRELRVGSGGSGPTPGAAGFTIAYDRTADDLPAAFIAGGKGEIGCAERSIRIWAMGDRAPWGP